VTLRPVTTLCRRPLLDARTARTFTRVVDGLPDCDCNGCVTLRATPRRAIFVCPCDACQRTMALERRMHTAARRSTCVCCGHAWSAHSQANVCTRCWDLDLCRVCWRRPGLVCEVCSDWIGLGWEPL